jgi:hypothetical protein
MWSANPLNDALRQPLFGESFSACPEAPQRSRVDVADPVVVEGSLERVPAELRVVA